MTFTVGKRIAFALAIELVLLSVVAVISAVSLARTTDAYESALAARRATVVPAFRAELQLKEADINHLRMLLTYDARFERTRDSLLAVARVNVTQMRDSVKTPEQRERWIATSALLERWTDGLRAAGAASKANDAAAVLRIRSTRTQPIGDSLYVLISANVADAVRRSDEEARRLAAVPRDW